MNPRIEQLPPKKLVGFKSSMCLADNKTVTLWQTFMPRRGEVANRINNHFISMQVYGQDLDFATFHAHTVFEKWAAVEVAAFDKVPAGMETYNLHGG